MKTLLQTICSDTSIGASQVLMSELKAFCRVTQWKGEMLKVTLDEMCY